MLVITAFRASSPLCSRPAPPPCSTACSDAGRIPTHNPPSGDARGPIRPTGAFVLAGAPLKSRCSRYVLENQAAGHRPSLIRLYRARVISAPRSGLLLANGHSNRHDRPPVAVRSPPPLISAMATFRTRHLPLHAPPPLPLHPYHPPPHLPRRYHDLRHATADTVHAPVTRLPRIPVLEELHEFEAEGLGLRIVRLPRLNVLQDEFSNYGLPDASAPEKMSPESTNSCPTPTLRLGRVFWLRLQGRLTALCFREFSG